MGDFQGACWEEQQPDCWSLGDKLGLGGAGDKPSSISDGVFQDRRNSCLLVICFIWIFIFAGLRLQRGSCLEKWAAVQEKVYVIVTWLKILLSLFAFSQLQIPSPRSSLGEIIKYMC